uniref:N(4)-(Beta-N-acetylglucosaminyl)-L-asparaginase (Trinotate prediction) n=1 Tax=Myxobolus squamalis TaxID=59785 RepID=A0A6B2G269_MYXSQ
MKKSEYHVVSTWNFKEPFMSACRILKSGGSSVEACLSCCRQCQELKCVESVGYGWSPNEKGETTLDAMIMNGDDMRVGCVGSLRSIKDAIGVAHDIMTKTSHSFLVGSEATEFATRIGYKTEDLSSQDSIREYSNWSDNQCYPNYWIVSTLV